MWTLALAPQAQTLEGTEFTHVQPSGWTFDLIRKYWFSHCAGSDAGTAPEEVRQQTFDEERPFGDRSVGSREPASSSFALLGVKEIVESQSPLDHLDGVGRHSPRIFRHGSTLLPRTTGHPSNILGTHHEALDVGCCKAWGVRAVG